MDSRVDTKASKDNVSILRSVVSEYWYLPTNLHGGTDHNNIAIFTTVKTSELKCLPPDVFLLYIKVFQLTTHCLS
jgi:hypothetical protein